RDQQLHAALLPRPLSYRTGGLRCIATTPVLAGERPAELGLRVFTRLLERDVAPVACVPDDQAGASEDAAVVSSLDHEVPEAVRLPTVEPFLHDRGHVLGRNGGAAQVAHHLGVG